MKDVAKMSKRELRGSVTRLRKALGDLIVLKDYRDWQGKTDEYLEKKPIVWANAQAALLAEEM